MKNYSQKKSFWAVIGSLILVIVSTALFVYKYLDDKNHYEKWKDYDECGV